MGDTDAVLEVQMFGGFTVRYGGRPVSFGRGGQSKSAQLFQLLLIHKKEGISKDQLLKCLYDWEEIGDKNNSLNSLIYRLRKQLCAIGLPEEEYISLRNGICCWCGSMETTVDSVSMEEMILKSQKVLRQEKETLLMKACAVYQGEFLPQISNEIWVTVENVRLKGLYETAVLKLCELLRQREDYLKIFQICSKAADFYPYEDWQIHQIDALLGMERYEEAYQIYRRTVKRYFDELGVSPSEELLKRLRRMSGQLVSRESNLVKVQEQLKENGEGQGAYRCGFPGFVDIYRCAFRMAERSGESIFLMLCSVRFMDISKMEDTAGERLFVAVGEALRRGDVYTRYSSSQVLILLSGAQNENCEMIFGRILRCFRRLNKNPFCQVGYETAEAGRFERRPQELRFHEGAESWHGDESFTINLSGKTVSLDSTVGNNL